MIHKLKKFMAEWSKALLVSFVVLMTMFFNLAYADDIGDVAGYVTSTFDGVAKLITASSYVAGLGFAVGSILKFKAHKDNPQQITVGVPIALMFVAAALIFLPSMFNVAGDTLFGSAGGTSAGITGITTF